MSHDGVRLRSVALLTTGALALPALAGCSSGDESGAASAAQDVRPATRDLVADGGTANWAVDSVPETLNSFQADAGSATTRIAGAVLPSLYTLDDKGRTVRNADYLEKAEIVEREPKQVVLYKLNQEAVWSNGREIGAADFAAQWRALSGKDSAYWTARNAGYERIEKIERGANDLEVRVTFSKPYADWRSLFSPLYPKEVMGTPDAFNEGARRGLDQTAGPFRVQKVDRKGDQVTLTRNPRWWGSPAKLEKLVLKAVPQNKRAQALADGEIDIAEIGAGDAERIALAARDRGAKGPLAHGPGTDMTPSKALISWARANGSDGDEKAEAETEAREKTAQARKKYAAGQKGLRQFEVRKSLEPAYTQLALNGAEGPLADERVRRAVARAIDRKAIAKTVLGPLGLPAEPVGSHLALAGQQAYKDSSGALGKQDVAEAQALLADAGWVPGGAEQGKKAAEATKEDEGSAGAAAKGEKKSKESEDDTYIVGEDDSKPGDPGVPALSLSESAGRQQVALKEQARAVSAAARDGLPDEVRREEGKEKKRAKEADQARHGGAPGAYAPKGTAAPKEGASAHSSASPKAAGGPLGKDGKPLTLRFVLPSGAGSDSLRAVADKISGMLSKIGVRTETEKVEDDSYFKDHIASGQYDLALYSWPGTAYPATDARPIFAKPEPAADGSLNVEQNYTRVGTDQIDQLFEQAVSELDDEASRDLVKKADARIWAAAGSIPLYQRPQLFAAKRNLANAGATGFETPHYEDMGFLERGAHPGPDGSAEPSKKD
ncbi:putative monoacyl phosphatidylinositol tetramannoside-binding protein LpqW precursor [Streptomyces sp. YIM 130001]|uniref:ABC transporter family substrate-binding protein n=1 Tax=Streptomyces sp. YIM 130001 TaxID=2259644 RepID=UPI000E654B46|nr:ABC transporter family substrate-binding protein [Streptomyces sp. YIM 130001]RII15861.1 putative monoacyl phosphatidylinositol tetramannoside-binding protein LpqW precursor [Streptomyces sp. YIM 130001]